MPLTAGAPDPTAFAPFGAFLVPPAEVGERALFHGWIPPVPGLSQQFHLNRVNPSALPLMLEQVERHPHASQLFLPVGVSRYLVTVMPSDAAGDPDPRGARAFVVPGTVGVVYHPGAWHGGISVLDREASFAVLMWRGAGDDDVFAAIPPLVVHPPLSEPGAAPHPAARGGSHG